MCGIITYIGSKKAKDILLQGLKKMEYRGYDSSGVFLVDRENSSSLLEKAVGVISELEKKMTNLTDSSYTSGIAHTRWATHGGITENNAHPHYSNDKSIYLVHNGIIENYQELKHFLTQKGYHFISETDSEVLVQLIHYFYQDNLFSAVQAALKLIEGAYGIAVIHKDHPDNIIVAKNGSPLIIGMGDNEIFAASDPQALSVYTQRFIFLEDKEIASLRKDNLEIMNLQSGNFVDKQVEQVNLDISSLEKGQFEHFMLKEIYEQPERIRDTYQGKVNFEKDRIQISGLYLNHKEINQLEHIKIVSCGSAWHAGLYASYLFEKIARIPTHCEYASEFRYRHPVINPQHFFIAVSQSGETADTLAAIKLIKETGANVFGITNVVSSSIARESAGGMYIHAGHEYGVASTKAFTAQLMAIYILCLQLAKAKNTISTSNFHHYLNDTHKIPSQIQEILDQSEKIKNIAHMYTDINNALFLGRDLNFPIALEGALKLKEISYIHAEAYPMAELKHGPLALVDENMLCFAIATQDEIYKKTISNIQEVKARKGKIVAIIHNNDTAIAQHVDHIIGVPVTNDYLQPILNVIPFQLLSYYIASNRNLNVDRPRNLAKSVTVE